MKGVIALCFLALVAIALARPDESHYTDKFDSINIDDTLQNERLREAYLKCLLDEGKCTPDAKELKSKMQEAMATNCAKCTPAQRKGSEQVIKYLITNQPEAWEKLKAKHDPTGKYSKKYEAELAAAKA